MPKEKVTLTLDADRLAELRGLVGGRSLSAAIDEALAAHLERVRRFASIDQWLAEMEAEDGPIPAADAEWAAAQVAAWDATRTDRPDQQRVG